MTLISNSQSVILIILKYPFQQSGVFYDNFTLNYIKIEDFLTDCLKINAINVTIWNIFKTQLHREKFENRYC